MNCANVKVTGGSAKRGINHNETYAIPELYARDSEFPDLFKANLADSNCKTLEANPVKFPNPGKSVDHFGTGKATPPEGAGCGASSGGSPGGSAAGSTDASNAEAGPPAQNAAPATDSPSAGVDSMSSAKDSTTSPAPPAAPGNPSAAGNAATTSPPSADTGKSSTAAAPPSPPEKASGTSTTSSDCTKAGESICGKDGKVCLPYPKSHARIILTRTMKTVGTCDSSLKAVMITVPDGTVCKGNSTPPSETSPVLIHF